MANDRTISTVFTADSRPFVRGVNIAKGSTEDFGKAFARLESQTKRLGSQEGFGGGLTKVLNRDLSQTGMFSANSARGILELSRGAEDAAVSFGLNGLQGAIRGSMNNLTQFATIMGGPMAGAIAGFAAAGVAMASPWIVSLLKVKDIAGESAAEVERLSNKMNQLADIELKRTEASILFVQKVRGISSSDEATREVKSLEEELEVVERKRERLAFEKSKIQGLADQGKDFDMIGPGGIGAITDPIRKRERLAFEKSKIQGLADQGKDFDMIGPGGIGAITDPIRNLDNLLKSVGSGTFTVFAISEVRNALKALDGELESTAKRRDQINAAMDAAHGISVKENALLKEKVGIENERNAIIEKRQKLLEKEEKLLLEQVDQKRAEREAQDMREGLEGFNKRIEDNAKRAEKERRQKLHENQQLERFLEGKFQGVGGKLDPLDRLKVPDDMREQLEGLLKELDSIDKPDPARSTSRMAPVVTGDSQSLLRAQYQAKEAAQAGKEAAKTEQHRKKLQDAIGKILDELRKQGRALQAEELDDVNLN